MSPEPHAKSGLLPARGPARTAAIPVLIRIPTLPPTSRRSGRAAPARRRRRLRKEVRAIGSGALVAIVASLGLFPLLGGGTPSLSRPATASGPTSRGPEEGPIVSLSIAIEAETPAGPGEPDGPAILPGYIVPNDGPEEPPHAGN